ncbi:MAG TPA: hypothetical protein VJ600_05500 [Holophagaceae bacterium]|nr:hypothetical protein [Holophagaceae bacterium]
MVRSQVLILALLGASALAQAPGTAEGTMTVNQATPVRITRAYAHLHDNAEGVLDTARELRILLADREQPADALQGLNLPFAIADRVNEGQVRGLMIRLDPAHLNAAVVTLLHKPSQPGMSLVNQTLSNTSAPALKRLVVGTDKVEGEIEAEAEGDPDPDFPKAAYRITFTAPITHEPAVTADLKGKAAQDSPQVAVLRAEAQALAKGDLKAANACLTDAARARQEAAMAQMGAQGAALAKQEGAEMLKSLKTVARVVVRGDRAAIVFKDRNYMGCVKVGGAWRME